MLVNDDYMPTEPKLARFELMVETLKDIEAEDKYDTYICYFLCSMAACSFNLKPQRAPPGPRPGPGIGLSSGTVAVPLSECRGAHSPSKPPSVAN